MPLCASKRKIEQILFSSQQGPRRNDAYLHVILLLTDVERSEASYEPRGVPVRQCPDDLPENVAA